MKVDSSLSFINSVVNKFQNGKECGDESFIIPPSLTEITKPFFFHWNIYCELSTVNYAHWNIFWNIYWNISTVNSFELNQNTFWRISQTHENWFQNCNNTEN